jgi:hypothetical protein
VIENTRSPSGNRVAGRTLRGRNWKSSRHVIRYVAAHRCGALEGGLVTAVAIRRFEEVVVADMAGGAGSWRRGHVRPGQSKTGHAVIERGCVPTLRGMASGTVRQGKCGSCSGVWRGVGILPVC